jgi:tetratricopeptide (TPR) repeat protein
MWLTILFLSLGCQIAAGQARDKKVESERHETEGVSLFKNSRVQDAVLELELAIRLRPDSPAALYYLTKAYRLTRQVGKASVTSETLLQMAPDSAYAHKLMGEAYDASFQSGKAQEEFQKAIAIAPNMPELHFASAFLYWRDSNYVPAAREFQREGVINPQFARPAFYLGDIAMKEGNPLGAVQLFQESLSLNPKQFDVLLALAHGYGSIGRLEDAVLELNKAEQLKPNNSAAHYYRSRLLRKLGRIDEAAAEERIFVTINKSTRHLMSSDDSTQ